MSSHTTLYSTPVPTKPLARQCPDGGLLTASYSIPVFWYMLFDERCIVYGPSDEPDCPPYPHLTTTTAEGLARAERRWEVTEHVFGRQIRVLFRTWLGFVRDHASDYLHCETDEWCWMFETTAAFEAELRACLAAFAHIPDGRGWNDHWKRLFSQAHASRSRQLGNLSYCGSALSFEVPWMDDGDCVTGTMSEKVCDQVLIGTGPDDLARYLETVCSPVDRVLPVACRCGANVFRLRTSDGHGRRTCAACGARQCILNAGEYWEEDGAKDWACEGCGGVEANLVIALEVDYKRDRAEYVHIGARCVACNRLAHATGYEFGPHLDQLDDSANEAWELLNGGDELLREKQPEPALAKYTVALAVSPTEGDTFFRGESLLGIGSCLFRLKRWEECRQTLTELLNAGFEHNGDPDPKAILGLCLHELGRPDEGMKWLLPRYLQSGETIFDKLEPNYRETYRPKLLAALTEDDYFRAVERSRSSFPCFPGVPAEWLARAYQLEHVPSNLLYILKDRARDFGGLGVDRLVLEGLATFLPTERVVEMFTALREELPEREAEFRAEFETIFARHAAALPPPLTPEEIEQTD